MKCGIAWDDCPIPRLIVIIIILVVVEMIFQWTVRTCLCADLACEVNVLIID